MPIKNATYAKYYSNPENREKLLRKMRERYDPVVRRERYEERKEEIRQREKESYKRRKIENSLRFYTALYDNCNNEEVRIKLRGFIESETYKMDSLKLRNYWAGQTVQNENPPDQ
jgi:hypothetical protein